MKTEFTNARTFGMKREHDPSSFTFEGLCCAVHSPMKDDLTLNLDVVEPTAQHLVKNHVNGVFVCGTTGESMLLSVSERKQLAEKWIEVGHKYGLCVIIHIGHEVLAVAQELMRHAAKAGADAVAMVPPRFFPPRSLDLLVQWVADVASAAPELPLFYYHLDVINYTPYPINRFLELASERVPNLCGMKYTDYNSFVMGLCLDACGGKFTVLMGREDAMAAALATGCCGFVGSTFSIMGKVYDRLMNAYAANDKKTVEVEMQRARAFSRIAYQSGTRYGEGVDSITIIKSVWEFLGIDNGPCRLLGRRMESAKLELLKKDLEAIGFFEWIQWCVCWRKQCVGDCGMVFTSIIDYIHSYY